MRVDAETGMIVAQERVNAYRLAHGLEDEKARRGYERTLREIRHDIAKSGERSDTERSHVQLPLGAEYDGDVGGSTTETLAGLADTSQQNLSRGNVSWAQVPA